MFKNPKEAIADLWEFIKTNLINRFQGMVELFVSGWSAIGNGAKGVAMAVAGIFSDDKRQAAQKYFKAMEEDILRVGKASLQLATGIDVEKTIGKTGEMFKEIAETSKKAANLERQKHDLYVQNTKFLITQANLVNEIATLTDISSDKDLDALVSLKATNDAIQVSRDLYAQRIALQEKDIQIKRQEMALGSNTKEDERS